LSSEKARRGVSRRAGGSGSSLAVTKQVVGTGPTAIATLTTTVASGSDRGKSDGNSGGTSTTKSGGAANFDVSGHNTSTGGGDGTVNRTTTTRGPNFASYETVRTTSDDDGTLTTGGHLKQEDGATSRDGTYASGQGGKTGVTLSSGFNRKDGDGTLHFATLHGTLNNDAHSAGSGGYVTAAENAGTTQSGDANTTGKSKLSVTGSEGSFQLTPIMDGETQTGQSWSGSRTTTTDTGSGAASRGGHVSIDAAGNVTATNLTNSDSGDGSTTTTYYVYSGSHNESSPGSVYDQRSQRTDIYTTTSTSSPAKGDQPASKSTTDRHDRNADSYAATITTTDNGEYGYYIHVEYTSGYERLQEHQTVGLTGNRATASIHSASETITESGEKAVSYSANSELHPTWKSFWIVTEGTRAMTRSSSDYHSEHTLDEQGHAQGGKFDANSSLWEQSGLFYETRGWSNTDVEDPDPAGLIYDADDTYQESFTATEQNVRERGAYFDYLLPNGRALRVQAGTYDRVEAAHHATRDGGHTYQKAFNGAVYPSVIIDGESRNFSDDVSLLTTRGSYDIYGNSTVTQEFSRTFTERFYSRSTADHYDGSWSVGERNKGKDIKTEDGVTTGHYFWHEWVESQAGLTVIHDEEGDILEGIEIPDAPKDLPAKVTAVGQREPSSNPALDEFNEWQLQRMINHQRLNFDLDSNPWGINRLDMLRPRHIVSRTRFDPPEIFASAAQDVAALKNVASNQGWLLRDAWYAAVDLFTLPYMAIAIVADGAAKYDPYYVDVWSDGEVVWHDGEGFVSTALIGQAAIWAPAVEAAVASRPAGSLTANIKTAAPEAVAVDEVVAPKGPTAFADEAADIMEQAARSRGLTRNAMEAAARASRHLKAGEARIGFVDRHGKLIGDLYDPKVGHDNAVDFVENLRSRVNAGDAFAVTVGKDSSGKIWSFGSQNFGSLPDYLKSAVEGLVD